LGLYKLYGPKHPVVISKLEEILLKVEEFTSKYKSLVFAESPDADLLINGEVINIEDSLSRRFIDNFRSLKLGSLSIEPALTVDELCVFIELFHNREAMEGEEIIRNYLNRKNVKHLIPSFATYKLVNQDEVVVKDRGIVHIEDIPLDKIKEFKTGISLRSLNHVSFQDEVSLLLIHNPDFLSEAISDSAEGENSTEELNKTLWFVAEYLIGEISSAKQEEINRRIINELKDKLLSLLEGRADKEICHEEMRKAFTEINAALQIKGMILLYKKHKKGIEVISEKISHILNLLPVDSQLLLRAKEELRQVGIPNLSKELF